MIGDNIRILRENHKMTRREFGEKLGVSGDVVNNWERNRVKIPETTVKAISSTFHVSEQWLLTGEGEIHLVDLESAIVDRLAREYNLGVGGVALLRAAARVINEFPDDVAVRLIDEIISDLQQAVAARQAVANPESRVVSDPNAPADSSLPPAGSAAR